MDEVVTRYLQETETEILFSVPALCVGLDDIENHGRVTAHNKQYEEVLAVRRISMDACRHQHAQTLNNAQKSKEILAQPPARTSTGSNATEWDIADAFSNEKVPEGVQLELDCAEESEVNSILRIYLRGRGISLQ